MAKTTFAPKAPIEKLPLAVRKDLRDNYESKKAEYETEIAGLLGFPLTINFNANEIWPYAEDSGANAAGSTFAGYVDGFIYALKSYVEKYSDIGKEYFKNSVTKSEVTLAPSELGEQAESISADVKDGVFRILFHQKRLGYNQSWLNDPFVKAIDQAPHDGFGLLAKSSIEKEYNAEIEEVQEEIGKMLGMSDVKLDPNFEENFKALDKAKKADQGWQSNFGRASLEYFRDGLKYQLGREGFKDDDMLQEGFAEAATSKTIKLRIVDKTKSGYAPETVLEDGVVYIQTFPDRWWTNVSDAGSGLLNLL